MTESVDTSLLDVAFLFMGLGLVAAFVAYIRLPAPNRSEYRFLGIVLFLSLLTEIAATIGGMILRFNMNLSNSVYALAEAPLLLFFYKGKIHSQLFRTAVLPIAIAIVIFGLINLFYIQGPFKINSYMKVASSATMLVVCVAYFFALIRELPTESITKLPMFWINTALLTYFAGAFAANLATNYLVYIVPEPTLETWIATWAIHNAIYCLCYLGIAWAFVLAKRNAAVSSILGDQIQKFQ